MSDFPPPPPPSGFPPPPPPPSGFPPPPGPPPGAVPPGYVAYGQHAGPQRPLAMAGFWSRVGAVIIDSLILGIPFGILEALVSEDGGFQVQTGYGMRSNGVLWVNVLSTLVGLAYYIWFEGGETGQTLGKRVLGIRVVDADTGAPPLGYGRAFGRYLARILSALPCGLGYLWMLWDPQKQTWHDKIVRSYVVKA